MIWAAWSGLTVQWPESSSYVRSLVKFTTSDVADFFSGLQDCAGRNESPILAVTVIYDSENCAL